MTLRRWLDLDIWPLLGTEGVEKDLTSPIPDPRGKPGRGGPSPRPRTGQLPEGAPGPGFAPSGKSPPPRAGHTTSLHQGRRKAGQLWGLCSPDVPRAAPVGQAHRRFCTPSFHLAPRCLSRRKDWRTVARQPPWAQQEDLRKLACSGGRGSSGRGPVSRPSACLGEEKSLRGWCDPLDSAGLPFGRTRPYCLTHS